MSEGAFGFLLLVAISTGAAIVAHWLNRQPWFASFAAAVCATVIFQIAVYLHAGRVDLFFPIAVVVGGFYSFAIALAIGWLFRKVRRPVAAPSGR